MLSFEVFVNLSMYLNTTNDKNLMTISKQSKTQDFNKAESELPTPNLNRVSVCATVGEGWEGFWGWGESTSGTYLLLCSLSLGVILRPLKAWQGLSLYLAFL